MGTSGFQESPVAIVGAREYIFSENIGVLGDIAAGKEHKRSVLLLRMRFLGLEGSCIMGTQIS